MTGQFILLRKKLLFIVLCLMISLIGCTKQNDRPRRERPKSRNKVYEPIDAKHLPKPFETASSNNPAKLISPPNGAHLDFPDGFRVNIFARKLINPGFILSAPSGDVFVAESAAGEIIVLRDDDVDGVAEIRETFASGLQMPSGMVFHDNYLYVAATNEVVRFKYKMGQLKADGPAEHLADLPAGGQNWIRSITFSPDGKKLLVGVGSETNCSEEPDLERGTVLELDADGKNRKIFASGIRAARQLEFYPGSDKLWTVCDERDGYGDELPPDYFTSVERKGFYGWPYAYIGPHKDPTMQGKRPDLIDRTIVPDVLIQAHSGAYGFTFYNGKQFPEEYRGNAFITLNGSSNRSLRTGYKVVRVKFKDGKAENRLEDFITGWMLDEQKPEVWGIPAGITVSDDGSLLVSDLAQKVIWRIWYKGDIPN